MQKNVIRSTSLKRATAFFTSLSLVYGCAITQSTGPNSPQLPGTKGTGFQIKSGPYCPLPSSSYPISFNQASGSAEIILSTRYGSGPQTVGFYYGSVTFQTDPSGFLQPYLVIQGQSGPNYYTIEATPVLAEKDLDHDIHATIASPTTYSSSNDTATLLFPGSGAVALDYKASTGQWTVGVSGHGDVIPRDSVYGGTADYLASATFETGICHPPAVELSVQPEYISPANGDGKFDVAQFHVKSNSSFPWTLSIQGNKPGPADSRGFPTKGAACTWSTTGSDADTMVAWDGTCNDRSPMVDGQYEAKLESAGAEDQAQIKIDNTPPIIGTPVLTLAPNNDIRYDANVEDPEVNGVASGLSNETLNLGVSVNGQPVAITGAGLSTSGTGSNQHSTLSFTAPPMPGATLSITAEDNVANRNSGALPGCNPNSSPVMLPQDLNQLLNQLNNLNLADPNALQNLQQIQNRLANIQGQLAASGFSTQSFHTLAASGQSAAEKKIQNLLEKRALALQELEAARTTLTSQLVPLDNQLQQLIALAENEYSYHLLKYEGDLRPHSLARYKTTLDRIENAFYYLTRRSKNTYDLFYAALITVLEGQVYRMLVGDFAQGDIPPTGSQDEQNYPFVFNKLRDTTQAKQLISITENRIQHHKLQLVKKQQQRQRFLDKLLAPTLNPAALNEPVPDDGLDEFESDSLLNQMYGLQIQSVNPGDFTTLVANPIDATTPQLTPDRGGGTGGGCCFVMPSGGFDSAAKATSAAILMAVSAATKLVKDIFNDLFKGTSPLPNPCPSPSLFPTPSPTPTVNECPDPNAQNLSSDDLRKKYIDREALSQARNIPGDVRDFIRLVNAYGGKRSQWSKRSTSEDKLFELEEALCAPGEQNETTLFKKYTLFEIHWYELRDRNGTLRVEFKIIPL